MTEQELAKHIVKWLEEEGWEVYQEVSTGALSSIADIVAVKNGLSWIVECKTRYGLRVLDQACRWLSYNSANFISVAVSKTEKRAGSASWYFHHDKGIGLITVDPGGYVKTSQKPKLIRTINTKSLNNIKNSLCEEHKHFAKAGSDKGGHYTPFKQTVNYVLKYIERHPGTTIKEMIDEVGSLHYSNPQSAKNSIAHYIRNGVINGVVVKQNGRQQGLYIG